MIFDIYEQSKEKIFQVIQTFLKTPPLIVWGSGATASLGLPSMWDLNEELKSKVEGFDLASENLEIELGKEKYLTWMPKIRKVIWEKVNEADSSVLDKILSNDIKEFGGIRSLIEKFMDPHPRTVNIVTTNYDRVLEYILSYYNFPYTDGFNGKALSIFDESSFVEKNVNVVKVHGSLNWFEIDGEIRFLPFNSNQETPQIIAPGKNKYQEAYNSPYRELIQKADSLIKTASSFLVIGFGFNDEHLTPKIKAKVKQGTPVVLITKKITESTYEELKNAEKYVLMEETPSKTKVIYKENSSAKEVTEIIEGDYWQLQKFLEII